MHASMQNATFAWKEPLGVFAWTSKGANFPGGPIANSAVSEYWPGLSKRNPAPSFSEMIRFAEICLYCPSTVKIRGGVFLETGSRLALPRYFVAVGPDYLETHKLIAQHATDQERLFRPAIKLKLDYNGLAPPEELLRRKSIKIQFWSCG